MNIQSIILLAAVLIAFVVVGYRYFRRQKRSGGCGSCNCDSCSCDCSLR